MLYLSLFSASFAWQFCPQVLPHLSLCVLPRLAVCMFPISGAFAKLLKTAIISIVSLRSHRTTSAVWADFHEICYFSIFRKICWENSSAITIWQKKTVAIHGDLYTFMTMCWILLRVRNFWDKIVEKMKTRILCTRTPPPRLSCRLWHNVEECGRSRKTTDENIIWRMRIACFTRSEYVILNALPKQQLLREFTTVLRYTYLVCLVCFYLLHVAYWPRLL